MSDFRGALTSFRGPRKGFFGALGPGLTNSTVTPGTYGNVSSAAQITVNDSGQITAISETPRLDAAEAVVWDLLVPTAFALNDFVVFDRVVTDTGAIIDEVVPGSTMTISVTGVYFVFASSAADTNSSLQLVINGASTFHSVSTNANMDQLVTFTLPLTAGDTVRAQIGAAANFYATRTNLGLWRLA